MKPVPPPSLRTLPEVVAAIRGLLGETELMRADLREWSVLQVVEAESGENIADLVQDLREVCEAYEAHLTEMERRGQLATFIASEDGRAHATRARLAYFRMLRALYSIRDNINAGTMQGDG